MARVSILVPVYNVETYLKRCLDSIINQTETDLEIICMDDGSTDHSGKILDSYARRDSCIRVVHKENSGYGATMNQAIALATGEYIGIVESDDYILADMYEVLYELAKKNNLDMVKADFYQQWDYEDGTEKLIYKKLTEQEDLYGRVLRPNAESRTYYMEKFTWNAIYKREFLISNKIRYQETPGASYQDNGFWFQTFYHAGRVMFLNRAFYKYKQDNPNASVKSTKKVYAMKQEYDFIRDFLKDQNEQNMELYRICFRFRMDGYLYTLSNLEDCYKEEMAEIICKECRQYEQLGEADYDCFPASQVKILDSIKKDSKAYAQKEIIHHNRIKTVLKGFRHCVIYGAGSYGRNAYAQFRAVAGDEIEIDVAVTSLEGVDQYWYGCILKEISEFISEKRTVLVVLAVKEGSDAYRAMMANAEKIRFEHIISYHNIMR